MTNTTTTAEATVALCDLIVGHRAEVRRIAEEGEVDAIEPSGIRYPPIMRRTDGGLAVVDGFHRLASMVLSGAAGLRVIIADGDGRWWDGIDCDSVIGECPALDAIYEAAGIIA